MRFPWFFNTEKKKIQIGNNPIDAPKAKGSVGQVGMAGKELHVNPGTNMTLERAKGRLKRVIANIAKRSDDEKKKKLEKTREKLKALIFILEDDD